MSKQKILLISDNKIFSDSLISVLNNDFNITTFSISKNNLQLVDKLKKNLFDLILFIDTGDTNIFELFNLVVQKINWMENRIIYVASLRQNRLDELKKKSITIVLYGDIIASTTDINSFCIDILQNAKYKKSVLIESETNILYPVFFEDFLESIRVVLSNKWQNPLCIFPKREMTEISFLRHLQKLDPEIKVLISKEKKERKTNAEIPEFGKYLIDFHNFEEKLEKTYSETFSEIKFSNVDTIENKNKTFRFPSLLSGVFIAFFIVFIFLPIFATLSLFGSFLALSKGYINTGRALALFSKDAFLVSEQTLGKLFLETSFSFGRTSAEGAILASNVFSIFTKLDNGKNPSRNELIYGLNLAKRIAVLKQRAETDGVFQNLFINRMAEFKKEEQIFMAMLDVFPDLAGYKGERKYLLLFQNNDELRPGGGFIGSYGILQIKNGEIKQFTIHDVYDADGQLKGHIEPPLALKKYLGVTHWFLRDSNFYIDFPTNAKQAAFFLEKETGEKVDGVIAINADLIKDVLSETGPLNISDFDISLTAENFTFLTQEEIQKHFFPGSRKKKNFLSAVNNSLLSAVFEEDRLTLLQIASLFARSLDNKNLILVSFNNDIAEVFDANGFSSTLADNRAGNNVVNDIFGVNDANIGQNKVNAYITRKIYHEVEISELFRFARATILYTNKSESDSIFGGSYKNFLRFILPEGSEITEITIDGKNRKPVDIEKVAKIDPEEFIEIEKTIEKEKELYGIYITVAPMTTKSIQISYQTPMELPEGKTNTAYDLLVFKQPGTGEDLYKLSLSGQGNKGNDKKIFFSTLDTDKRFSVEIRKNE